MLPRYHRPLVVACSLSWFLLGLHLPAVHRVTHHGAAPDPTVLALLALFAAVGALGTWALLRAPGRP